MQDIPVLLWIAFFGLIAVIAGFVILELARPYPDERKRREEEKHRKELEEREAARQKRIADADERVRQETEATIQETIAKGLTHKTHGPDGQPVIEDLFAGENIPEPDTDEIPSLDDEDDDIFAPDDDNDIFTPDDGEDEIPEIE